MTRIKRWLVPALLFCGSVSAAAQTQRQILEAAAMSVSAYEAAKDKCIFEPIINTKFPALDDYYRSQAPAYWDGMKRKAAMEAPGVNALGGLALLNPKAVPGGEGSECQSAATAMTLFAFYSPLIMMGDPAFSDALQNLSARVRSK